MDRTTTSSHAASALLHGLFLLLAFMAPVTLVLEDQSLEKFGERIVSARIVEADFDPPTRYVKPLERNWTEGMGSASSSGHGGETGPRPRVLVESAPSEEEPSLAAAPETIIEDVAGLLAGFADNTAGPDLETLIGDIDDGGGDHAHGGFGFGMAGRGVSCGGVWTQQWEGVTVTHNSRCGPRLWGEGQGFPRRGSAGGLPRADLGDKDTATPRPTVLIGRPVGCLTDAACSWKAIIAKVIKRHKRELEHCYDRSLDHRQKAFSAVIDVSFGISPEGGKASVEFESDSGVAAFDDCVVKRVAHWEFPKTGLDIRANYPFRFSAI